MKAIETDVIVRNGKIWIGHPPGGLPPGRHRAIVLVDEPVAPAAQGSLDDFPVHDFGPWPENLSLRREDLYGDDER
jgi:hypothetical protein